MSNRDVDTLIEHAVDEVSNPSDFRQVQDLVSELREAQQLVSDLELRINHIVEQLVANLGAEVRKRQPKLDVGLRNGHAHCGYRSRSIMCRPDVQNGKWEISGGPFAKSFSNTYPHLSKMGDDVSPLAHAIADFFSKRYRTLGA